jgi:hypothetical protein
LDAPEHVDSGNIKFKIGPSTNFFQNVIFISKNVSNLFHDLKNVKIAEKSLKIGQFGQFYPILPTFYEFKSRFEKSW